MARVYVTYIHDDGFHNSVSGCMSFFGTNMAIPGQIFTPFPWWKFPMLSWKSYVSYILGRLHQVGQEKRDPMIKSDQLQRCYTWLDDQGRIHRWLLKIMKMTLPIPFFGSQISGVIVSAEPHSAAVGLQEL